MRMKIGWGFLLLMTVVFLQSICAQDVITKRTGTIAITTPDGRSFTVGKDEALAAIPPGSRITIISGEIEVSPTEGFIQVEVNGLVATVEAGSKITASLDLETGMASFRTDLGAIDVVVGENTIVKIDTDQHALLSLDKTTGAAFVISISGVIKAVSGEVEAKISDGAAATVKVNAEGKVDLKVDVGRADVVVGNTTAKLEAGEQALLGVDKATGETSITSVSGTIETETAGVKAEISDGSSAEIKIDVATGEVHVESVSGETQVTSIEGEVSVLTTGETLDTAASEVEITTPTAEPTPAEAVEPESLLPEGEEVEAIEEPAEEADTSEDLPEETQEEASPSTP